MKLAPRTILLLAILLIVYGYWGAFTESGNKVYEEMDAMLPFYALIAGVILFVVFLILIIMMQRKKRKDAAR